MTPSKASSSKNSIAGKISGTAYRELGWDSPSPRRLSRLTAVRSASRASAATAPSFPSRCQSIVADDTGGYKYGYKSMMNATILIVEEETQNRRGLKTQPT